MPRPRLCRAPSTPRPAPSRTAPPALSPPRSRQFDLTAWRATVVRTPVRRSPPTAGATVDPAAPTPLGRLRMAVHHPAQRGHLGVVSWASTTPAPGDPDQRLVDVPDRGALDGAQQQVPVPFWLPGAPRRPGQGPPSTRDDRRIRNRRLQHRHARAHQIVDPDQRCAGQPRVIRSAYSTSMAGGELAVAERVDWRVNLLGPTRRRRQKGQLVSSARMPLLRAPARPGLRGFTRTITGARGPREL